MKKRYSILLPVMAAAIVPLSAPLAYADLIWDPTASLGATPGGDGDWDNSSLLWYDAAQKSWVASDNAIFSGAAGAVDVTENIAVGDITFSTTGYVISSGNGSKIDLASPSTITTGVGISAEISAVLSGTGSFVKAGDGALTLSAKNTHTGGSEVTGGSLILGNKWALGIGANTSHTRGFTLRDGVVDINGQRSFASGSAFNTLLFQNTITFGGQAGGVMEFKDSQPGAGATPTGFGQTNNLAFIYDAANNPGTATVSAGFISVNTSNNTTKEIRVGDSSNTDLELHFTGQLGQTGSTNGRRTILNKTGAGTMMISNVNYFPRLTVTGGTVVVGHEEALGIQRDDTTNGRNQIVVDALGTLDLNGFENTIDFMTGTGLVTNSHASDNSTLTMGRNNRGGTFGGVIEDGSGTSTTGITKIGTGTLTLSGANTYTGATTIQAGTLTVSGSLGGSAIAVNAGTMNISGSTGDGNVTVSGGTFNLSGSTGTGTVSVVSGGTLRGEGSIGGSLSFSDGALFTVDDDTNGAGDSINIVGDVALAGTTTITFVDGAPVADTVIELFTYAGSITSGSVAGNFDFLGSEGYRSVTWGDSGGVATLQVVGSKDLEWTGNVDNNWDILTTQNWADINDSNAAIDFAAKDTVSFVDDASVTLVGDLAPASISIASGKTLTLSGAGNLGDGIGGAFAGTIQNEGGLVFGTTSNNTLSGLVSGAGSLTKNGATTLTLTANNDYTGATVINDGIVHVGVGGTTGSLGTGAVTLAAGAELIFNRSNAFAVANAFDGTGIITKAGGGRMTVSADNSGAVRTWNFAGTGNADIGFGTVAAMGASGSKITVQDNASGGFFIVGGVATYTTDITMEIGSGGELFFNGSTGRIYVATGVISGDGQLTKQSGSVVVLTGENTHTGGTVIDNGILQIGNGGSTGSLGTGAVVFNSDNDRLRFNRDNTYTVANLISGAGNVTQTGTGTTIFTANNNYTGGTTINNGTLQLGTGSGSAGNFGTGDVTLASGSTLIWNRTTDTQWSNAISGPGTLVLRGGSNATASAFTNEWLAFGNSPGDGGYIGDFHLDTGASATDRGEIIFTHQYGDGTTKPKLSLLSLSGYGHFRTDWGDTGNRTISVNQDIDTTYAGRLIQNNGTTRSIHLEKLGSGTLTLTGNNSYSNTNVDGTGTLQVGDGGLSGTLGSGAVTIGTDAEVKFNRSNQFTVANTFAGTGVITKAGAGRMLVTGDNSGAVRTWNFAGGALADNADIGFSAGGFGAAGSKVTVQDDTVGGIYFDHDGGGIDATGGIEIGSGGTLNFNGITGQTYTVAGVISGAGAFNSQSGATTILTATNTYSGGTVINGGGTIQVGDGGTTGNLGTGDVNVVFGSLVFNRSDAANTVANNIANSGSINNTGSGDLTLSGVISGSGTLTQSGTGSTTLNAANTYTGDTIVEDGTLVIGASGSIDSSMIVIKDGGQLDTSAATFTLGSGQTLGGSGTITGDIALATGAYLAPGESPGTLSVTGALTLGTGSFLDFELQGDIFTIGGGVNDLLVHTGGDLALDGTLNVISLGGTFGLGDSWVLIDYDGGSTVTGSGLVLGTLPTLGAGLEYSLTDNTGDTRIELSVISAAVPEPSSLALFGLGGMAFLIRRRR